VSEGIHTRILIIEDDPGIATRLHSFVPDAVHELGTPLTALRTNL
jgi:hypothetical protein